MNYPRRIYSSALSIALAALFILASSTGPGVSAQTAQTAQVKTPADTVREFYRALSQKRFRDALMLSIYKPAIEGLSGPEIEELRPDFEKMAAGAEKVEVKGEQLSNDTATVFVRMLDDTADAPTAPVPLLRIDGQWIVGEKSDYELVKQSGKDFFFKTRIDVHEGEVKEMMQRIQLAELAYASQHNNTFADLPTLVAATPSLKDLESTDSTGYRFSIKLLKDGKNYSVNAEPARYNRTGRLSFYMDQSGIKSADVGGKPLAAGSEKQ
jgi:hypothetical protein